MAANSVFHGSLSGRFFKLATPVLPGTSFLDTARSSSWDEESSVGKSFFRGFCKGEPPHNGELSEDLAPLAYDDEGSGVWRLWLREDSRTVGRNSVEERAMRLAIDADADTSLSKLQKSDRLIFTDKARAELLQVAVPQIRIVPIVVLDGLVWIGRSACISDRTYVHLLRQVFGDIEPTPLTWDPETSGWTACSYATLMAFVGSNTGELAPDVVVTEVEVKNGSVHLKTADTNVLGQVADTLSESSVKSLSFEVFKNGIPIAVDVDCHGLYQCQPMRSVGGLPQERIRRRFLDVQYAASRISEVMFDLVSKMENEEEGT